MTKPVKRVAVTGGAGQIAYSLLFRIAAGDMLGDDQPVALHILEVPEALAALNGVKMELEDCIFPLLKEIIIGSDPVKVFEGIHYALLVGAKPRGPGMERADLLNDNGKIFIDQGKALNEVADPNVKVLVVGNPCNTNCLITMHHAPKIPRKNFHAMTRLDQNRAVALLAGKGNVLVEEVQQMTIWGNHSATQVPDFYHATIKGRPVLESIPDRTWLEGEFIARIQKRGAEVIAARGKSSAASAANAIVSAVKTLEHPKVVGEWFSSCVIGEGNPYGMDEGLIYSYPCRALGDGKYQIIKDLKLNDFLLKKLKETEKELIGERDLVLNMLK